MRNNKVRAYAVMVLAISQIVLMLASWLLTAAMPDVFVRSLLSAEGIRWFFGHFEDNIASPLLVWLVVGSIAYGVIVKCGVLQYHNREYRQRVAMRLVIVEFFIFVAIILALTLLPHAILLNVMGNLFPSSFSQSVIPYAAFALTVMGISFGIMSSKIKGIVGICDAAVWGIASGAPLFLLYVLAAQLYCSVRYLL